MKILKLEFENINNLKGNHTIDFTAKPLADADIFAIIGATGSGKSTILDVITLALFNRTPRFKKVSKKEILEKGSIITKNEKKASAKITYSVGETEYISVWNIAYNSRNNLNDYHMEIWKNGVLLDLHRRDVPKKNEEIIGLDYEQFTKAIILSQGEFSKFLKADNNERSELLEKITGTAIYRELGVKVHEIHREKKADLQRNEEILNTIIILSDEEIGKLEKQQKDLKTELEKQKTELEKVSSNLKQKTEFLATENELKKLQERQVLNTKKITDFATELDKLFLHKKVVPYRKDLDDFTKKTEAIEKNKSQLEHYQSNLKKETERKNAVISEQQTIVKQEITEHNFLDKNKEFENRVKDLISELKYIYQDGLKLAEEINTLSKSKYLVDYQFDSKTVSIQQIDEKINEIENLLKNQNYSLSSDVQQIEKDKQQVENQIQDYKELKKYIEQLKIIEKDIQEASKSIVEYTDLLEKLPQKLEPLQKDEELSKLKIQKIEIEQKIASFDEQRKELEDGKPCQLCGSVHHPYAENLEIENKQTLSVLLKNEKQHFEKITKQINEIQTQEKLLKSKIETQKNNISKYKEKQNLLVERTKKELHNSLLFDEVLNLNLSELLLKSEKLKVDLQVIISLFQKIEPLQNLKIKIEQVAKLIQTYKAKNKEKDNLYKGDDIVEKMNSLQTIFNESSSNMVLHQTNIKREEKLLSDNTKEFQNLTKTIEFVKQKTEIQTIEELKKAVLSDSVVLEIEKNQQQLNDEKTQIETLLKQTKAQFEQLNTPEIQKINLEELQKQESELKAKNEKYIGEIAKINQQLESNKVTIKRKKEFQNAFEKSKKEFLRWDKLKDLIGDATGKKFSTFAQTLTLKQLILFTNKRLQSFSGRYLIYSEPTNQELMIIDQIQGNTERSVKTLSGGETFLVSLALALSLSDMASKNVKLESLFIDEGFGTLDEDTLENAINLLEKLQSESDKMVGVISHVKELKERISVQIQLEKNSQGHSKIKVVG
ncbi:MAG: AAA family ATPase [Flavobacteriaceae bacterium]|nr:AAA family ATPase [Flavobacteriaceae bacterium]